MNKKVEFQHIGKMPYAKAWDYQTELFDAIVQTKLENRRRTDRGEAPIETKNYLLFVEHPHVYTLGKSGKEEHLLLDQQGLEKEHVEFFKINRGGDITYHGPGQIVGYPILDLDNFFTDIHKYLRFLEEAIILTLADFGIKAGRIDGLTGVWIGEDNDPNPRKICAMGVKTSRWVTMHGFALNVNADLKFFGNIVPCGISDKAVTSMEQELGHAVNMKEVEEVLKNHLATLFEMEIFENQNH
ncbi:lipoyl(octanoyl) transferase LipB [Flammeovirga sp. EKP202]|uniref:lipoyl(octanoyl) transferase LipB n=1 Tax=Flammeovirga sp. EKP202 TaxID=2770592 RepID=UPI00165F8F18|nr:lipoyl(octanoyl) transferase LipB [Flammeovirga sp. EKP202]MBD0404145.1 lipoyl(octanoyl) transferase LipB [Flammeovirga sp. EKP202]